MRRKLAGKPLEEILNANCMTMNQLTVKTQNPTVHLDGSKISGKLKDKISMQLKNHQSNQNYLLQEFPQNENEQNEEIAIYINTKYDIVEKVARQLLFKVVKETDDWNIFWIDGAINSSKAFNLKRNQRVNHFPGTAEISRKDKLQKNLKMMLRYFPMDYDIFPKTWTLPKEKFEVLCYLREQKPEETFIIKPPCSSQGRGIILIKDIRALSIVGNTICQLYISNPFLIDGYKFDLRIYVFITSCDPLRIYIYKEGLARFATCRYEKPDHDNLNNVYMHLTNYSVQKNSDKFDEDEILGTKRRSTTIYDWFNKNGYNADKIWEDIDDVILKTILCANNNIRHHYSAAFIDQYRTSACFELLGFDILLDDTLKPYVLEVGALTSFYSFDNVNHSPSLDTDTKLDLNIKTQLLTDIFNLVIAVPTNLEKISDPEQLQSLEKLNWSKNNYVSSRKALMELRKLVQVVQMDLEKNELGQGNGFRILYPILNKTEKYLRFHDFNLENQRSNLNRCVLNADSENKKIFDIKKELLPKIITRPNDMYKYYKFKANRDNNLKLCDVVGRNPHISRCPKFCGIKDTNIRPFNVRRIERTNERSTILLQHSKDSLKKILSQKRGNELPRDFKKNINSAHINLENKPLLTCSGIKKQKLSQKLHSELNKLQPVICNQRGKKENSTLHKVHESYLIQQISTGIEWESSLISNKVQYASKFNFESVKKSIFKSEINIQISQDQPNLNIVNKEYSYSLINDKNEGTLHSITYENKNIQLVKELSSSDIMDNESFNDSIGGSLKNWREIKISNPITIGNEFNFLKFNNRLNELRINNRGDKTSNILENKSKKSSESYSSSDIFGANILFAAEIEDPGNMLKPNPNDVVKHFINSAVEEISLTPSLFEYQYNIAHSTKLCVTVYQSEKSNKKFNRPFFPRDECRNTNPVKNSFHRTTRSCKRKYSKEHSSNKNNNDDDIFGDFQMSINQKKFEREKNKISKTIVEIDDFCLQDDDFYEHYNDEFLTQHYKKSLYWKDCDEQTMNAESNKFNNFEFYSICEHPKSSAKQIIKNRFFENEFNVVQTSITKSIKSMKINSNGSPKIISNYDIEPKFNCKQFNLNNIQDCEKRINDVFCKSKFSFYTKDYSTTRADQIINNNVCEINIGNNSTVSDHQSFNVNQDNFNLTISMNSISQGLVSDKIKTKSYSNSDYEKDISIFINRDGLFENTMIKNNDIANHSFKRKNQSKGPFVFKYIKQSMRKIDHYVDMCMGNVIERCLRACLRNPISQDISQSSSSKFLSHPNKIPDEKMRFKLPDLTIRKFNDIIHILPNRKHKNKSFHIESLKDRNTLQNYSYNQYYNSMVNNISISESSERYNHTKNVEDFHNPESSGGNKSLICQYLKNVGNHNKNKNLCKLSSTRRLCKILIDKTNRKSRNEAIQQYNNNLVLQYVNG